MPRLPFLLLVSCLLALGPGAAAAAVRLAPGTAVLSPAADAAVLEDPAGTMSLADVQSRGEDFRRVALAAGTDMNFGYSSSAWWLRFEFAADPGAARDWWLEVAFPTLDRVDYFGPGGERLSAGDRQPFAARPLPHRNFVFPLRIDETGTGTAWLRVVSEGTLTVPLRLWQPEDFRRDSLHAYALHAGYFGMLLALALYNLLLWFSLRENVYLAYVLSAVGMGIGQLSMSGLGNEFLWPAWPQWGHLAAIVGFSAAGLFGALFTRGFLETRRSLPQFDGAIIGLAALFAACMVLPLVAPYRLAAILVSLAGVTFSLLAVAAGLRCWLAGNSGARAFIVAWTALLLGAAVAGLRSMNLLPTTFVTLHALQIGSALEMLLLSFALADRINALRRERDAAQAENLATRQQLVSAVRQSESGLARRVAERTQELETLNARLRENERQLQALAHADPLTGLANRLLFGARIDQSMQLARRSNGQVALLLIDIDRFRSINDNYGRAIGDEVLRLAAERLRAAVRQVDTVARLGGDEFAVVLSAITGSADAERMAEKIIAGMREPMRVLGMALEVSASIGIAVFSGGEVSAGELLRRADQTVHVAKGAGRDCFRMFAA